MAKKKRAKRGLAPAVKARLSRATEKFVLLAQMPGVLGISAYVPVGKAMFNIRVRQVPADEPKGGHRTYRPQVDVQK